MSAITGLHGIPVTPLRRHGDAWMRRWRRTQLVAAGYDELSAQRLARRVDLDLHAVLDQREQSTPRVASAEADRNHG
jgi:hypothetical protein